MSPYVTQSTERLPFRVEQFFGSRPARKEEFSLTSRVFIRRDTEGAGLG